MQIYENKESLYVRKEFNSHRIYFEHQHVLRFIVLGHQYGGRDVICVEYSHLSRKRPPLVHDKVMAHGRWSSMGKIKKKTQTELINVIT